MHSRANLKTKSIEELESLFKEIDEPDYRGGQLFAWIWKKGVDEFSLCSNFSRKLRECLSAHFYIGSLRLESFLSSGDGVIKYVFQRKTGETIESVFIPSKERRTVCVSCQVGCPLRCSFCATGQSEFKGNLSGWEIADQVLQIGKHRGERITNVVFMGMGEPFLNWPNVKEALYILNSDYGVGIGSRRMTISTAGVVPGIYDLTYFPLQARLAVSLNSAIQEKRQKIMPVARTYPLGELQNALRFYYEKRHRMVTLEYVLIGNFNTTREDFLALEEFTKELTVKINLIPLNPIGGISFLPPSKKEIDRFFQWCLSLPCPVIIRESKGKDVKGACGQLTTVSW